MNNKNTVTVFMSTYNGEKYLEQQIESILHQEHVKVKLFIRDDGSKDNTIKILRKYSKLSNIHVIYGDNIGYAKSFLKIIENNEYTSYYSFSDQDDIWLPNKLHEAIR